MDYKEYKLSAKEIFEGILLYSIFDVAVSYFFYRSKTVFAVLFFGMPVFFYVFKKKLIVKRKKRLLMEFSETLYSVSINIRAGFSVENAFIDAYKDIQLFYGTDCLMLEEILRIRKGLEMNLTLEELVEDFSNRSGEEDIKMFSDVLKNAKRNGGNITEVLSNTADRIREKICVDAEIETLITEKKLELRIMEGMPFLILLYLEATSAGYFDVLYEGIRGRAIMTAALIVYCFAAFIGDRIMRIKV